MSPLSVLSPVDSSSIEEDGEDASREENGNIATTSSTEQTLVDNGTRSGSRVDNSSDTISLGLYDSKGISDSATVIVYAKDNVFIHPGPRKERISGRLSLLRKVSEDVLFLAWLPYTAQLKANGKHGKTPCTCSFEDTFVMVPEETAPSPTQAGSHQESRECGQQRAARTLYAVHPIPLSELRAIRRHTPTLGWHHIILVLHSGLTLPPLYFSNGGVKKFLSVLKLHTSLLRSAEDQNTYLVNDVVDPLQRSMSVLNLQEVHDRAAWTASSPSVPWSEVNEDLDETDTAYTLQNLSATVFSKVSKLAATTTASFLASAILSVHSGERDYSDRDHSASVGILREEQSGSFSTSFSRSMHSKMHAQKRHSKSQGDLTAVLQIPEDGQETGDAPFVLRQDEGLSTSTSVGNFELLDSGLCAAENVKNKDWRSHPPVLTLEEWTSFLDAEGRVVDHRAVKSRAFYSGLDNDARKEVWPFLLGYFPWDSTSADRDRIREHKREEYAKYKAQWQNVTEKQAQRFAKFRERKSRIKKDVVRTDGLLPFYSIDGTDAKGMARFIRNPNVDLLRDILMSYSFYNFDLGYCQGMSDLLSPILFIMRDESDAFWCFVGLMDVMESNFHRDQNGMHSQLLSLSKLVHMLDPQLHNYLEKVECLNFFFCYRWILIIFKREFEYSRVMRLWDALWSQHLCAHFHLFVCVAVLQRHRNTIIHDQLELDALLRLVNDQSLKIDLDTALHDAEMLFRFAGEAGQQLLPGACMA